VQKALDAAGGDINKVGATRPYGYTIRAWENWGGSLPFSIRQFDASTGSFVSELEHSQHNAASGEYQGQVNGNMIMLAGEITGPYPVTSVCHATLEKREGGNLVGTANCIGGNGVSILPFPATAKVY
jgi:hypothetical protein